jgi:SAM-dependent methyltransferase
METTKSRALESCGTSTGPAYQLASRAIREYRKPGGTLLDVGCGTGSFWPFVSDYFDEYLGTDVVRYEGYPDSATFIETDLDTGHVPLPDGHADVVASLETIEHLENPRAFFRELVRLARPGGLVLATTPNQLSIVSLLSLITGHHFRHFKDGPGHYPAHLTALLELDLIRIARECGLVDIKIYYSNDLRIPFTLRKFPGIFRGRRFSDNIGVIGRKPA